MNVSPIDRIDPINAAAINPNVDAIQVNSSTVNAHTFEQYLHNEAFLQIVLQSFQDLRINVSAFSNNNSPLQNTDIFNAADPLSVEKALNDFVHSLQNVLGQSGVELPISIQNGRDDFINDLLILLNNPGTLANTLQDTFDQVTNVLSKEFPINFSLEEFLKVMLNNVPNPLIGTNDSGSIISTQT